MSSSLQSKVVTMTTVSVFSGREEQKKAITRRMSSSAAPVLTGTAVSPQGGASEVSLLRGVRREGAAQPGSLPQQVAVLAPHAEEEDVRAPFCSLLQFYECSVIN